MGRARRGARRNELTMATETKRRIPMTVTFLAMDAKPSPCRRRSRGARLQFCAPRIRPCIFTAISTTRSATPITGSTGASFTTRSWRRSSAILRSSSTSCMRMDARPAWPSSTCATQRRDSWPISDCCLNYVGKQLGYFFLYHACVNAWARPISRLLVNTCTLDHPRALPLYQRLASFPIRARNDSSSCRGKPFPSPPIRAKFAGREAE